MNRSILCLMTAAALLGGFVRSGAAESGVPLRVDGYLVDPVGTRDGKGQYAGTRAASALPRPPVEVLDVARGAVLVRDTSGKEVWLDRMDVKLNHAGSVEVLCQTIGTARGRDRTTAATMGAGPSCFEK